jgi:uncharacterized membrane protein SpoIIM required for sporulation
MALREAAFVKQNKPGWERLERSLDGRELLSPDEASDLYIKLTDDLSYARTFYPGSSALGYLNGLAGRLHQHVYRNKPTERGRFTRFWSTEVPLAMAATRKELLLSFTVFVVAVIIGAFSAHHDPDYVRLQLGEDYVEQTLENIRSGKPMDIYASEASSSMFAWLPLHNIMVALQAFAFGLLFSVGTGYFMLLNGFMLGSFQYFFFQHGVGLQSMMSIWVHGTLEISSIVVAGSAGFTMGNAFLFPGTLLRVTSLLQGARRGLTIVIGLVPVFILAGFLESFVTRLAPELDAWILLLIIGGSLAFVIWYFIIHPFHVQRTAPATAPDP